MSWCSAATADLFIFIIFIRKFDAMNPHYFHASAHLQSK